MANMRWSLFLTVVVFLCYCSGVPAAAARELELREDHAIAGLNIRDNQNGTSVTSATGQKVSVTTTDLPITTTRSTTESSITHSHKTATAATSVPSLDTSNSSGDTSSNSSKSKYTGGLPIQPALTPAWGVGGFILLVSGAALAFIGIRKPWVYIHLSTAFLTALGVTILIIYVMNPPVSDAVQGGYLVAIFFTGVIFGGLALVFKEITEGLCCLLGGFCIGMWLMSVKSGGLLTDSGPKVGFIIAFTVGFYCFSFSHYTRSYASIVCTSMGGATALVLGIDCFSRAGLKEFWLYIWGLNDDMFPLNTDSYPVTRNIRVELAVIIIIAAFGVIAQLRLWKVIKARRAEEEQSRREAEREQEESEIELGRRMEEKNLQERAKWEHMYGRGADAKELSVSETAVADESRRGSDGFTTSGHEPGDSMVMQDMASPTQTAAGSEAERNLEVVGKTTGRTDPGTPNETTSQPEDAEAQHAPECHDAEASRPTAPVSHKVVGIQTDLPPDDGSEHGAVVGSEVGTPRSKRFSSRSLMNGLSWRSGHVTKDASQSQSQEALIVHEDANSSVLGIVDDLQSVSSDRSDRTHDNPADKEDDSPEDNVSSNALAEKNPLAETTEAGLDSQANVAAGLVAVEGKTSEIQVLDDDEKDPNKVQLDTQPQKVTTGITAGDADHHAQNTEVLQEQNHQQPQPSTCQEQKRSQISGTVDLETTPNETSASEKPSVVEDAAAKTLPQDESTAQELEMICESAWSKRSEEVLKPRLDATTVQSIPEQTSRIVNSFRTREWAKHLADAEVPEVQPIQANIEDQGDSAVVEETAAPVNVESLLQTPFNSQSPPATTSPVLTEQSRISPEQAPRQTQIMEAPQLRLRNSVHGIPVVRSPPPRNFSSTSLTSPEQGSLTMQLRNNASTPLLSTIGPRDRNSKEAVDSPRWSGPPPLLAVRENMVRNRMSSTSLRYDPWSARNQSRQSLTDPAATFSIVEKMDENTMRTTPDDEDDVPLSQRRAMLQRQTMQSPTRTSIPSPEPARPSPASSANSKRPAAVMAAWRRSVRDDLSQRRDPLALNSRPLRSTSPDRPRSMWGSLQQMRDSSTVKVDTVIADGMQRGSMTDLHRQAMRRMQASANRKL